MAISGALKHPNIVTTYDCQVRRLDPQHALRGEMREMSVFLDIPDSKALGFRIQ
jgi:hypothetical protein